MFYATLKDIIGTSTPEPISEQEEAALIVRAQHGDDEATNALLQQYGRAARNALARFSTALPAEDAEQELVMAFMGLVKTHDTDKSPRLAGRVVNAFKEALAEAAPATGAFSIPARTHKRFVGIIKKAGSVEAALEVCGDYGMSRDVFLSIAAAEGVVSMQDDADGRFDSYGATEKGYAQVEDYLTVAVAFGALDEEREMNVMRLSYGFEPAVIDEIEMVPEGGSPLSARLVGTALNLSRQKVQRTHAEALDKMRVALAVDGEVEA